jgi:hypothetical protein
MFYLARGTSIKIVHHNVDLEGEFTVVIMSIN